MDPQNPVARRAALVLANSTGTPEEIAAALDAAGVLARPAEKVGGPYPVWVRTTGVGASIDVHPLVAALVRELAAQSAEDSDGVAEELAEIAAASGPQSDALVHDLLDRLGGTVIRYGATAARELADRIARAAGPVLLPVQKDRRAG